MASPQRVLANIDFSQNSIASAKPQTQYVCQHSPVCRADVFQTPKLEHIVPRPIVLEAASTPGPRNNVASLSTAADRLPGLARARAA